MKIFEITANRNSIDTYNAFSHDVFVVDCHIIIPYINIKVINEISFDSLPKDSYIDYSYLIFKDVVEFAWSFNIEQEDRYSRIKFNDDTTYVVDYHSGDGSYFNHSGYEFRFKVRSIYLGVGDKVKLSKTPWVPVNKLNHSSNMIDEHVSIFFKQSSIPFELISFVNGKNSSIKAICLDSPSYYSPEVRFDWA